VVAETGREPKMCGKMTTTVETRAQEGMYNEYVGPPYDRTKFTLPGCRNYLSISAADPRPTSAANPPLLLSIDWTDSRTDGHSTVL